MFICNNCISKRDPLPMPFDLYPRSLGPCEICEETAECIDYLGKLPKLKQENNTKSQNLKTKEIITREMCGDARVFRAMIERESWDKSFTDKGLWGFTPKYTQSEVREIWFKAIAIGMQEGLNAGSLEGQRIDTSNSCKNPRHKEFYKKFLKLAGEYNCAILYHPIDGMCVVDMNPK